MFRTFTHRYRSDRQGVGNIIKETIEGFQEKYGFEPEQSKLTSISITWDVTGNCVCSVSTSKAVSIVQDALESE